MVHSFSGGMTHPATDLLESGEDTGDIAVSFRTGPHPGGYTLDRIQVLFNHIPAGGAIQPIALHPDVSGSPGNTEECFLRTSRIAESAVAWSVYAAPHLPRHLLRQRYPHRQHHVLDRVPGDEPLRRSCRTRHRLQMSRTTGQAGVWSVLAS